MMRALVLALACLSATSAFAQGGADLLKQGQIATQYELARRLFLGQGSDLMAAWNAYPKTIVEQIEGVWTDLAPALDSKPYDAPTAQRMCAGAAVRIAVDDAYTFRIDAQHDKPLTTTFVSRGGNLFFASTSAKQAAERFGFDALPDGMASMLLAQLNGPAFVMRVGPDMLVVQIEGARPSFYARCRA